MLKEELKNGDDRLFETSQANINVDSQPTDESLQLFLETSNTNPDKELSWDGGDFQKNATGITDFVSQTVEDGKTITIILYKYLRQLMSYLDHDESMACRRLQDNVQCEMNQLSNLFENFNS